MKKYILPFMSIAMLMAMVSCSSSDDEVAEIKEESTLVLMTFTATQESNAGTRAALNGNSVDWQTNDEISIFDGEGNRKFTLTDVEAGKFSGTASSTATKFTAVYPYTSGATLELDGKVSGITLPAEQTATPNNSFDPMAALMMAYTTDKTKLDFKNAVSLVKVTTQFACKQIVLSANDDIAGTGTLSYNNGQPSITFTSNQSKTVTLKPAAGNTNIVAGTYYIAIRPHVSSGFSISFINSNDTKAYTRTSTKENTFNRSKIKNLGTFEESGKWTSTIDENGNVKASQQVDMGEFDIGGTNFRLIFTKSNLKKDGYLAEKETDYGDYFAWGATEPWYTSYTIDEKGKPIVGDWEKTGGYTDANAPTLSQTYDKNEVLSTTDDTALKILKGDWQIPTQAIWDKFITGCTTKKWNISKQGYEFVNNGQTLFLPAAGYVLSASFIDVGSYGDYWSGTAKSSTHAHYLRFNNNGFIDVDNNRRYMGFSVRPVRLVAVQPQQ